MQEPGRDVCRAPRGRVLLGCRDGAHDDPGLLVPVPRITAGRSRAVHEGFGHFALVEFFFWKSLSLDSVGTSDVLGRVKVGVERPRNYIGHNHMGL